MSPNGMFQQTFRENLVAYGDVAQLNTHHKEDAEDIVRSRQECHTSDLLHYGIEELMEESISTINQSFAGTFCVFDAYHPNIAFHPREFAEPIGILFIDIGHNFVADILKFSHCGLLPQMTICATPEICCGR